MGRITQVPLHVTDSDEKMITMRGVVDVLPSAKETTGMRAVGIITMAGFEKRIRP